MDRDRRSDALHLVTRFGGCEQVVTRRLPRRSRAKVSVGHDLRVAAVVICAGCGRRPVTAPVALVPGTVPSELRMTAAPGARFGNMVAMGLGLSSGSTSTHLVSGAQILAVHSAKRRIAPLSVDEAVRQAGGAPGLVFSVPRNVARSATSASGLSGNKKNRWLRGDSAPGRYRFRPLGRRRVPGEISRHPPTRTRACNLSSTIPSPRSPRCCCVARRPTWYATPAPPELPARSTPPLQF
jgi:hypothetical protein